MKNKKKRRRFFVFFLILLPLVALGFSSFAIYKGIRNYITTSSYFEIKKVNIQGIENSNYVDFIGGEVMGKNIFLIDAPELAERIKRRFPSFSSVIVTRVLPSELSIVAKERLPVAVLKRDMCYVIDADGVILSSFTNLEMVDLPLITGLEKNLKKIDVGKTYQMKALHPSLLLAKALKIQMPCIYAQLPNMRSLKVTKIDAVDQANLSFYFNDAIQVKIGNQDFDGRLSLLQAVLKTIDYEIGQVNYIDLRSKEPVVAYKENGRKASGGDFR